MPRVESDRTTYSVFGGEVNIASEESLRDYPSVSKHFVHVSGDGDSVYEGVTDVETGRKLAREAYLKGLVKRLDPDPELDAFLAEYAALCERHGYFLGGCGCCGSPWVEGFDD